MFRATNRKIDEKEAARLKELERFQLLDTLREPLFDKVTQIMSLLFHTPMAFLNIVDEEEVLIKSVIGWESTDRLKREETICGTMTVDQDEPTIYEDTWKDPIWKGNPFIDVEGGLRFYAGAPLVTSEGYKLGTVCIADIKPRQFSEEEKQLLINFSKLVINQIELRLVAKQKTEVLEEMVREHSVRLERIREEERGNIAREIHDELGQQLTAIKLDVAWLNKKTPAEEVVIKEKLGDTLFNVEGAISAVRRIATELRPSILNDLGLIEALDWYVADFGKRTEINARFECNCWNIALSKTQARIYLE